jgi:hypothetical protein
VDNDEIKDALKQALKEWLDEKVASFGWWSIRTAGIFAFAGLIYLILILHGWIPPHGKAF